MIAVISDLHFEEEASDVIKSDGREIIFRRNLDPRAYRSFIAHMADELRRRKARKFELVIAGDLFDFNRTSLWFADDLRPYVSLKDVSAELERKLLGILEATCAEPAVARTLALFHDLSQGKYQAHSPNSEQWIEQDFPCAVKITCLAGNHDRLANATPAVRRRIRQLIGQSGDECFGHYALYEDPDVLIRHGHEYDNNNFAVDF